MFPMEYVALVLGIVCFAGLLGMVWAIDRI
jgi:hypothetical protein